MKKIVSITSQGQLTIPKSMLAAFGIKRAVKALVRNEGKLIIVEPKGNFWSLAGALKSKIRLSDKQLKQARKSFEQDWPRNL